MGCNGYTTTFFTERFSLREKDSSQRTQCSVTNINETARISRDATFGKTTQTRLSVSYKDVTFGNKHKRDRLYPIGMQRSVNNIKETTRIP